VSASDRSSRRSRPLIRRLRRDNGSFRRRALRAGRLLGSGTGDGGRGAGDGKRETIDRSTWPIRRSGRSLHRASRPTSTASPCVRGSVDGRSGYRSVCPSYLVCVLSTRSTTLWWHVPGRARLCSDAGPSDHRRPVTAGRAGECPLFVDSLSPGDSRVNDSFTRPQSAGFRDSPCRRYRRPRRWAARG
jgi:hypothetical protein